MALALLSLAAAVAPAAFMLHFVYVRDKYEREPLGLVLRVYFISFLAVIPAVVLEGIGIAALDAAHPQALLQVALLAFLIVGVTEEGSKFLFLRRLVFRRPEFNEVYDGILYAVAVSLGFATVENIAYVFSAHDITGRIAVALARALLSVPVHALLGVMMGFFVGRARFVTVPGERGRLLLIGYALAAFAHGLYDFSFLSLDAGVASDAAGLFGLIGLLTIVMMWVVSVRMIAIAQAQSPFKRPNPIRNPLAAISAVYKFCPRCGARAPRDDRFCRMCGATWMTPGSG